jgi:hypothetical protein
VYSAAQQRYICPRYLADCDEWRYRPASPEVLAEMARELTHRLRGRFREATGIAGSFEVRVYWDPAQEVLAIETTSVQGLMATCGEFDARAPAGPGRYRGARALYMMDERPGGHHTSVVHPYRV